MALPKCKVLQLSSALTLSNFHKFLSNTQERQNMFHDPLGRVLTILQTHLLVLQCARTISIRTMIRSPVVPSVLSS